MSAPKVLTVDVTAEDIQNGKPGYAECCPIALAVRRLVGHQYVSVLPRDIATFATTGEILVGALADETYVLPQEAADWAIGFDVSQGGSPFTFTATLMEGE